MGQSNRASTYKNMLLVSTLAGVFGVYFLYKGFKTFACFLAGVWAVVGIIVRILIVMDKRSSKNRKEI